MVLNRFNMGILTQIILISLTGFAFLWSTHQEYMLFTSSFLVLIWVLQILYLLHYLKRFSRDMQRFIEAFRNQDASLMFNISKSNNYFIRLYNHLNDILQNFRLIRLEKEVEYHFFKEVVNHVDSGLIAFDKKGEIRLINKVALKMLCLESFHNINELDQTNPELSNILLTLKAGNQQVIKSLYKTELKQISIRVSETKLMEDDIKLIALHDITREINKSEVEAWQKLLRILSHEIMNSVSPINLLSESLIDIFEEKGKRKPLTVIDDQSIDSALLGLHTILKRSTGLTNFIETYQNLAKLPALNLIIFELKHLINHIKTLLDEDMRRAGIEIFISIIPSDLTILADEKLIEQVLINLVKNAKEALDETYKPIISIEANLQYGSVIIRVSDNGKGMPAEILDNIFVPFFTTKKNGSGIGLSLSRQIMQMHKGTIRVQSEVGKGSVFTLSF